MVPFQSKQWRSVPILPVANQSRHSGGKRQAGLGSLAASNPEEKELLHQANVVGCHVKTGENEEDGIKNTSRQTTSCWALVRNNGWVRWGRAATVWKIKKKSVLA